MRSARARWLVLGTLLVAALSATLGADRRDPGVTDVVAASVPRQRSASSSVPADAAPVRLDLARMARPAQAAATEDADLFGTHSWRPVPPPSAPAPAAPPRPTAPPLPFVYLGRMIEDGTVTVFLSQQGRPHIAKAGDTLEQTYRVEAIADKTVTLTYLPLHIQQQLTIGVAE